MTDFHRLHDEENADLSALLHSLAPADWERPSLCDGWRVRDVVGHILYGNGLELWTLPWKLGRFGFNSDRSGKHYSIKRAEGLTSAQLVADFDERNPWKGTSSVFPARLNLMDRLVHHQDIRRALERPRDVPIERTAPLLPYLPKLGQVFRSKQRMRGLRFEATDTEWSWGDAGAQLVRGPAEPILMSTLGRGQALMDCEGDGVPTLRERTS
ncbi:MAG: maleylpyruvate isomerase family mycothiol-dependent enzyme [Acidimicrobiales bacterium]